MNKKVFIQNYGKYIVRHQDGNIFIKFANNFGVIVFFDTTWTIEIIKWQSNNKFNSYGTVSNLSYDEMIKKYLTPLSKVKEEDIEDEATVSVVSEDQD